MTDDRQDRRADAELRRLLEPPRNLQRRIVAQALAAKHQTHRVRRLPRTILAASLLAVIVLGLWLLTGPQPPEVTQETTSPAAFRLVNPDGKVLILTPTGVSGHLFVPRPKTPEPGVLTISNTDRVVTVISPSGPAILISGGSS